MKRRFKKMTSLFLAASLAVMALSGCADKTQTGTEEGKTNKDGAEAKVSESSKDTIVIGLIGAVSNLDAKEGVVNESMNVYSIAGESLLKQVNNEEGLSVMTTEGSITESYEVDEENSGIIFHIKKGIKMQDGTELNADDVVASVMHMQEGTYYGDIDYERVEAQDEYTVFVGLKTVGQPVVNKVATIPVFSKDAYDETDNEGLFFTNKYTSCGQYQITEWVVGDSITLTRFDDYYGGTAPIKNVVFRIFSEANVAMMEMETGGVDVLMSPDYQSYVEVKEGTKGDQYKAEFQEGNMLFSIYFNMASEKLQDYKLRKAIMLCLDRTALSDGAFDGWGSLSYKILGNTYSGITTYTEDSWPYKQNIEEAKTLMKEAGYGDGVTLDLITHNGGIYYQKVAEMFANQVKEIGVTVNIATYEPATFKSTQNNLDGWDISTTSPNTNYITNASDFLNNALIGSMHCDAIPTEGYEIAEKLCTDLKTMLEDEEIATATQEFEKNYFENWLWWIPVQLSGVYTVEVSSLQGFSRCQSVIDLSEAYFK